MRDPAFLLLGAISPALAILATLALPTYGSWTLFQALERDQGRFHVNAPMGRRGALPLALLVVCGASAPMAAVRDGATLLFHDSNGSLPAQARRHIYELLGLELTADGMALQFSAMRDCGAVGMDVRLLDLNGDGIPEVQIVGGNSCFSGNAGSHVWLFVRDGGDQYRVNLGFPGAEMTVLPSRSHGFADLRIEGPGFCPPIWRWDGARYRFFRNEPLQAGACAGH